MKEWPLPSDPTDRRVPDGLVLVGLGSGTPSGPGSLPPLQRVSQALAALLERPLLSLATQAGPDAALAALMEQGLACGPGWLAGLEIDVGLSLADGRCWAEVLGAWRQPALLVIPAAQLQGGLPAAATALLRHWQVPLVGLLQWGGAWQGEARRRDGLPWLGPLSEQPPAPGAGAAPREDPQGAPEWDSDADRALVAALSRRWQQLDRG